MGLFYEYIYIEVCIKLCLIDPIIWLNSNTSNIVFAYAIITLRLLDINTNKS